MYVIRYFPLTLFHFLDFFPPRLESGVHHYYGVHDYFFFFQCNCYFFPLAHLVRLFSVDLVFFFLCFYTEWFHNVPFFLFSILPWPIYFSHKYMKQIMWVTIVLIHLNRVSTTWPLNLSKSTSRGPWSARSNSSSGSVREREYITTVLRSHYKFKH